MSSFEDQRDLFEKLMDRTDEERRAYLEEHVGSPELRSRMLELFAGAEAENFLDNPVSSLFSSSPHESSDERLAPNTLLAERYRIKRRIAVGGFSEVYEAFDLKIEKRVVVKVLALRGEWNRKHFESERKSLATLDHPGIVAVSDMGKAPNGQPYIVLEYIEGRSLQEELDLNGRLDTKRISRLIVQIASALRYAHEQCIIHRDLKPANIMLSNPGPGDEVPVIIDFGIAKFAQTGEVSTETLAAGTLSYLAPEQEEPGPIDATVDAFCTRPYCIRDDHGKASQKVERAQHLSGFVSALPEAIRTRSSANSRHTARSDDSYPARRKTFEHS